MGNVRTANAYHLRLKDLSFGEALDQNKLSLWTDEESSQFIEAVRKHG